MTASDDYPDLASQAWYVRDGRHHPMTKGLPTEARQALAEIDALRADVANLLTMCSEAGIEWPEARFALGGGAPGQDVAS